MITRTFTWIRGVVSFLRPLHLLAVLGIIVFLWLLIMGDQGFYRLSQLYGVRANLTQERHRMAEDIERKQREKRRLEDPANLETIIRKELGYIKPGEIVYEEQKKK